MERGDVYLTDLGDPDEQGHVQADVRPSIIVQINSFTQNLDTVIVVPTTANLDGSWLTSTVLIKSADGGLDKDSLALCHQIRVINKDQFLGERFGTLSPKTLKLIEVKLVGVLGLRDALN